jgi:hypothetical protein
MDRDGEDLSPDPQAPTTEGLTKDCNLAEIKYLQAYLLQSGLTSRAPDVERGQTSSG